MAVVALERHGNVAVVRLDNGVTNPVSPNLALELHELLGRVRNEYRAMLLAGGEKFFCIGLDLPKLLGMDRPGMSGFFERFSRILLDLLTMPIPTACAVRGHALGAGTTFLLACDYRFAASGKTLIGLPEIRLGAPVPYLPDMLLRQIAGDRIASDMMYRGELIDSSEAEKRGILHGIAPKEQVEALALERLEELGSLHPQAFSAVKANRVEAVRSRYEAHSREKNEEFLDCWFSEKTRELLREGVKKF